LNSTTLTATSSYVPINVNGITYYLQLFN
jgi:hypothetical protein